VFIIRIGHFNFTRSKVAVSATGKMFNCCTIASWSPASGVGGTIEKEVLKGIAAKNSASLLPEIT
jgi:hypothetical protein